MPKRRKLGDLYVIGKEIEVDDGQGAVVVWIQKLNAFEHEQVIRKAAAARAVFLSYRNDPSSQEYQLAHGDAQDFGVRPVLIEFLMQNDVSNARISAEAEIAAEEEWTEKDYLQGLHDAWVGGLSEAYALDPEDGEAKRVFSELKRFSDLVEVAVDAERKGMQRDYEGLSDAELQHDAALRFLDRRGDQAFIRAYARQEVFLATRLPEDHKKRYFEREDELDTLAREVISQLEQAYLSLSVEAQEGKDLPPTPLSLVSSEGSEKADQEAPSGQLVSTP